MLSMNQPNFDNLKQMAFNVRENILRMSTNGGAFTGASLSCTDLITYLYGHFMNISRENLKDSNRDYFFLSKGHVVPVLYATFIELGWMDKTRLAKYLSTDDSLYWHPNRIIDGIEFHSGSLGHLLSVATGVAIDIKNSGAKNRSIVMLGDGELNEGSNWEASLTASAYKLDNLIAIVDRNKFQANITTEDLIPLEPLEEKFKAFGWSVRSIDGHNFSEINDVMEKMPFEKDKPNVIIANTVRGKGVPSIEARWDKWFCNFSQDELKSVIDELHENN